MTVRVSILAAALMLAPVAAVADVRLPHIFSDHMVLQAGMAIPVWGWADPGERVDVRLAGQVRRTEARPDGRWLVTFGPVERSTAVQSLDVKGAANSLTVTDVLIGEVWLASGQSNMEKPLGIQPGQKPTFNYEAELQASDYPDIRLFKVKKARAGAPADDVDGAWVRCGPQSLDSTHFSAAAYFFGRRLHTELATPVGLIDSTWGGTRIEPWTPPSGFAAVPSLEAFAEAKASGPKVEGTNPSALFNGMIAPLVPFALRGVIWYQGESNIIDNDDGARYADKMKALVTGWRTEWKQPFSIYYVQVAPHLYHVVRPANVVSPESAPRLWEAQTASLTLPKTGMVVTTDLVDDLFDIHPRDKKTVGERLANLALAGDYGRNDIPTSGPMYRAMTIRGSEVVIAFDHADGGLKARDGKPLSWFTIAGADARYYPALARIEGDTVIVSSPRVTDPVRVRLGWDEAAQPNLENGAGLPAVPFRTDNPFLSAQ